MPAATITLAVLGRLMDGDASASPWGPAGVVPAKEESVIGTLPFPVDALQRLSFKCGDAGALAHVIHWFVTGPPRVSTDRTSLPMRLAPNRPIFLMSLWLVKFYF